jgi:hypothetical protein
MGLFNNGYAGGILDTLFRLEDNRRQNSASKIQQMMADARLKEIADAELAKQKMRDYNKGMMETPTSIPVPNPNAFNMMQPQGMMQPYQVGQPFSLQPPSNMPTIEKQYPSKYEALAAQGKNPEAEYMKGAFAVISESDPEKGLALRERFYSAKSTADLKEAMFDVKKSYDKAVLDLREKGLGIQQQRVDETIRNNRDRVLLSLLAKNNKGDSGAKPPTLKFQNDYAKATTKRDELSSQMDDINAHADRLLKTNLSRITGLKGAIPNIPGSEGSDAKAALDSFKSKLGLTTLASLKSGTGAGLGQVTEAEHKLLQNFVSELDNAQSENALRQSIKRIQEWSQKAKGRINTGYDRSVFGKYDREQNGEVETPQSSNGRFTIKRIK